MPVPPDLAPERRQVFLRMVDAARTRGGRLVVVGAPGLGKSFLVDALVRALLPERTVLFVRGRAGATEPFAGLADLLGSLPPGTADPVRRQVDLRRRESAFPEQGRAAGRSTRRSPACSASSPSRASWSSSTSGSGWTRRASGCSSGC